MIDARFSIIMISSTGRIGGCGEKKKMGRGNVPLSHYKSGLTKLRNGTAAKMSMKVLQKGIVSEFVGGLALDAYYGLRQSA